MIVGNKNFSVSILTVTLNRADFLEDCLLSIKNQKYPFIEHIVIDGASTDSSLEILKNYQTAYNLKWISEKDDGVAIATNKGFRMATGDILCICDSDDMLVPEAIQEVVAVFNNKPDVDVVFADVLLANHKGGITDMVKYTNFDKESLLYSGGMVWGTSAVFWKRSVQEKIGAYDEKYKRSADYDFFMRLGLSGAKFEHINKFLSIYRLHPGQLTKSLEIRKKEDENIFKKYLPKKHSHLYLSFKKNKILAKRFFYFILRRDFKYILKGFFRRIKNAFFKNNF